MTHLSLSLQTARYLGLDATRPEEELGADLARGGGGWRDERGPVSQRHGVRRRSCEWAVSRAVCRHWLTHRRLYQRLAPPPPLPLTPSQSYHNCLCRPSDNTSPETLLSGSDLMSLLSPRFLNVRVTQAWISRNPRKNSWIINYCELACWPVLNKAEFTLSNKHVYGNVPNHGFGDFLVSHLQGD